MMNFRSATTFFALLGAIALPWSAPATATEVYTWTDERGVVHYSDAPRAGGAMEVIEVEEVYRPGTADAYPDTAEVAEPSAAGEDAEPSASGEGAEPSATADAAMAGEPQKSPAQQKREEMARVRAERRAARAETDRLCALHRQRFEGMEPARRVMYTDEDGETVRLDDDKRLEMIEESRAFLAANCD